MCIPPLTEMLESSPTLDRMSAMSWAETPETEIALAQSSRRTGLEMTREPKNLRFFQARFKPVTGAVVLRRAEAPAREAAPVG